MNNELCSLPKGFPMEDLMSSAKISTKEVGSCSSTELEKKLVATFLPDSHVTVS